MRPTADARAFVPGDGEGMVLRSLGSSSLGLLLILAALATGAPAPAAGRADPFRDAVRAVVRVEGGWVRGGIADNHLTFAGIPYAAPPVGVRRWRQPSPHPGWRGVRDATGTSTPCLQAVPGAQPPVVGSEDCLTVDVTVPRHHRGRRLPVLVWLHGGSFTTGAAREYDATRLATGGGLVVVTVNYRLGALGFLSSPALTAEHPRVGSGNYGLLDQAAAMRWVRRNVGRFGGDPSEITLAGQSAGGRAVCAHLAAPSSRRLFDRAIVQSGGCARPTLTEEHADANGRRVLEEVGCEDAVDTVACLRSRPGPRLAATLQGVGSPLIGGVADDAWGPVAGTPFLPRQPEVALRTGRTADVPLLLGTTRDESRPFVGVAHDAFGEPLTETGYHDLVAGGFGDDASGVLAEYPAHDHPRPALALAALLTDQDYACPTLRTAEAAATRMPVHAYELREDSDLVFGGYPFGAFHGWDLAFLWDVANTGYPPLDEAQQRLSDTMIGYWAAFARRGDPNGPGRPRWPRFDRAGTVLGLSADAIAPTSYAADHRCDFWATR